MYKPRLTAEWERTSPFGWESKDCLFAQYVRGYLEAHDPEDKNWIKSCLHNMVRDEIVASKHPLVIEYRKNPDKFPSIAQTADSYYSCEDVSEMRSSDLLQELFNIEDKKPRGE